jgi:hypothetical protein
MIANIRRFKGARPAAPVVSRPIAVDGRFDDWRDVAPEFRDTAGDPVHRDHPGWGKAHRYIDRTGRNDLVAAKVSVDAANVHFYARAAAPLTPRSDPAWMVLLIDVDANPKTGWLGYDAVVNRTPGALERNVGGRDEWASPVSILLAASGREVELSLPRADLGLKTLPAAVDFKWLDNIPLATAPAGFTLHGDAAPNDRYNFHAPLRVPSP